jgi:hypothetical protein
MDMVKLVNRKTCCQHRISCFQMQLLNQAQQMTYSYNFANGGIQTVYDIRPSENCSNPLPSPPPPLPSPAPPASCPGGALRYARHVRIDWAGGADCAAFGTFRPALNFAELKFMVNGVNVAFGKTATAFDTDVPSGVEVSPPNAENAVDGDSQTMFRSDSAGSSVWWTVDLGVSLLLLGRSKWCQQVLPAAQHASMSHTCHMHATCALPGFLKLLRCKRSYDQIMLYIK